MNNLHAELFTICVCIPAEAENNTGMYLYLYKYLRFVFIAKRFFPPVWEHVYILILIDYSVGQIKSFDNF